MQEPESRKRILPRVLHSIRARLTLSYLAVIVVAMGLSGFLLLSLMERYFLQAMQDSLLAQARITAQALAPSAPAEVAASPTPSSAYNTLQQQTSNFALEAQNVAKPSEESPLGGANLNYLTNSSLQLSSQLDTRIRILDKAGSVVVDSAQTGQATSMAADPLVAEALAGKPSSRVDRAGGAPAMSLAFPWQAAGRLVGVIYLSQPLRDVTAVLNDLRLRWLLATMLALILSAGVGLLLSGAITRPLRRLTEAVQAVAGGELDQRVPVESRDELGQLSHAFNEMARRLHASRQAQVDLVANVSHELRTPLTTVKGMVETLRDGAVDDVAVRDRFLAAADGETDRMIRLVSDLLLLSRADSGALDLQRASFDLGRVVSQAVDRLRPLAETKRVLLLVDAPGKTLPVCADAGRVELVLINLLDNAIKYSRPGGRVVVCFSQAGRDDAQVQVRDDGVGIPAQALSRVGERFFRADRARSRDEGGSGLGLAIARALIEAHGGQLTVNSMEGQGTCVTFTLPSAWRPDAPASLSVVEGVQPD